MIEYNINLQDIIPDREIIKLKNEEFAGIDYEIWEVSLPVFGDQVETLLENGFGVSMLHENRVSIHRQLNPSPEKLSQNRKFWHELERILND